MPSLRLRRAPTLWSRIGLAAVAVALAGCLSQQATTAAPGDRAVSPQRLLDDIRAEIGQARCSSSAQCRTLAIGAKACGGPDQYLPFSTAASDALRLNAWATELATRARQDTERGGMVSNCQVVLDPGASCQAGRCALRQLPAAAPMLVR